MEEILKKTILAVNDDGFRVSPEGLATPDLTDLAFNIFDKIYREQRQGYDLILEKEGETNNFGKILSNKYLG